MYYDEAAVMDDEMDDAAGASRLGDMRGNGVVSRTQVGGGRALPDGLGTKQCGDPDPQQLQQLPRSPLPRQRSRSDGGTGGSSTPRLSPSPYIFEAANRRTSKDDSVVRHRASGGSGSASAGSGSSSIGNPVTPRRPAGVADFLLRGGGGGLSLQMPRQEHVGGSSSNNSNHSSPATARAPGFPAAVSSTLSTPSSAYPKQPVPVSPKLDSSIYGSPPPANILPRRSRGLDFSRAATSLHHSTLAEQSSPDSSPTIGTGGMRGFGGGGMGFANVPGMRRSGDFSGAVGDACAGMDGGGAAASTSLWSMMGSQERTHTHGMPGSLGTGIILGGGGGTAVVSDSSSSSDEDDLMDDYGEENFASTPQAARASGGISGAVGGGGPTINPAHLAGGSSPVINSGLLSFQQRQRRIKMPKKRLRAPGPLGLGFSPSAVGSSSSAAMLSKSPPNNVGKGDIGLGLGLGMGMGMSGMSHSRRESISWAANQLHISGNESDGGTEHGHALDGVDGLLATPSKDGQKGVIRRVVTRRGNLLPKTKGFARIRAALAEENQPVDAEFRREAEVVRQVRERDMDLEPRIPSLLSPVLAPLTGSSTQDQPALDDVLGDEDMMTDGASGQSAGSFKQYAMRHARGQSFWANFSDSGSSTPPSSFPPPQGGQSQQGGGMPGASMLPRHSSSGLSDMSLDDSPALTASTTNNSMMGGLSQTQSAQQQAAQRQPQTPVPAGFPPPPPFPPHFTPPTAAEITRRINAKRRRGADADDLLFTDPQGAGFKRRAVSPSMGGASNSSTNRDGTTTTAADRDQQRPGSSSVHNSPVLQSPMARDYGANGSGSVPPWSTGSRSGSGAGTPLSGLGGAAAGAAGAGDSGPVTRGRRSLSVGGEGLGIFGVGGTNNHQQQDAQLQHLVQPASRGGGSSVSGAASRAPSEAGSVNGSAAAAQVASSQGGSQQQQQGRVNGGATAPAAGGPGGNLKGRVGFMGMVETNDGLMRMSIE